MGTFNAPLAFLFPAKKTAPVGEDYFRRKLGGGKYRFKGSQRMRLEHRFWTYLICREPYVILGHYEWGTDVIVSSVRDEPPFQPPGLQDPSPAPVWVPGP